MKRNWNLHRLFSPYEIAAAGMQIHLIFFATGMLLLVTGRGTLAVTIALLVSAAGGLAAQWGAVCPGCGNPLCVFT